MGKYKIALSDRAKDHLTEWKKSGHLIALRKIEKIFIELPNTPFYGKSNEDKPGIILDYDIEGSIVGIEVLNASTQMVQPNGIVYEVA